MPHRYGEIDGRLKPAIPFIYLYESNGGQSITDAGALLTWDTTDIISSHFTYTNDTNRIYLNTNTSGLYKIHVNCSFVAQGAVNVSFYLRKNGTMLSGTRVYTSVANGEYAAIHLDGVVYLQKDDYIDVYGVTLANEVGVSGDASNIIIQFLPMYGFNNESGGRQDYKGVLR